MLALPEIGHVLEKMRDDGTNQSCPLCLEKNSMIVSHDDRVRCISMGSTVIMACCGVKVCSDCSHKSSEFMGQKDDRCYNCREPLRSPEYWEKSLQPNDQRAWIFCNVGYHYLQKKNGVKQNVKKGMKFLHRAADLDYNEAQDALARYFFRDSFLRSLGIWRRRDTPRRALIKAASRETWITRPIIFIHDSFILFIFSFEILFHKNSLRLLYLFFYEVLLMFELFLVFSYLYIEQCSHCNL